MRRNKIAILFFVISISIISISCKKNTVAQTESGLTLNFINKGDSSGFNENDIVLINMKYVTGEGVEMFNSLTNGEPLPLRYNKDKWKEGGLFYEAINACGVGDSVTFSLGAHELFVNTFKTMVPDTIPGESVFAFNIGVVDVMTIEEYNAFRNKGLIESEAKIINEYLTENSLEGKVTASGLTYIVTEEGSGNKPVAGETVVVHYRGAFMDDKQFDSSFDRGDPIEFPLGQGAVIKGWDEGLALLNVGSKATFLIPSALAYGERGRPGAIPPNSVLKFDVELVDIKK